MSSLIPAETEALRAAKARLRREALGRRALLVAAAHAQASAQAAQNAPRLLEHVEGRVVSLFAPFRDEIDTAPLAALLWSHNARVALPVVVGRDVPLVFRLWQPGDQLELVGAYGIPTPLPSAPEVEPDDLIVPLAAFDRRGYRIGYGAGHYDRTLARLRALKGVRAFGYAFACQEVSAVPHEGHDEPVDGMITETDVFSCGGS